MLNDINSSKEISSSILSQNPDDASQNPIALKNSNDPEFKKWENEQNLKYSQILSTRGNEIISFAIGSSENEEAAIRKAKMYAALLLPEKQSVFIQSATEILLSKNQKCVVNRSQISECIRSIKYEVIGKYSNNGVFSTAIIAYISRNDLFKSLNNGNNPLDINEIQNINKKFDAVNLNFQNR